jgi:hypothetical protein
MSIYGYIGRGRASEKIVHLDSHIPRVSHTAVDDPAPQRQVALIVLVPGLDVHFRALLIIHGGFEGGSARHLHAGHM